MIAFIEDTETDICVIADEIIINGIIFSQPVQDVQCHFLFGHPGLQAINICQVRFCGFILYRYLHVIIIHGHRRSLYCKIFSQIISPDLGIADDLIQCHILIYTGTVYNTHNGFVHIQDTIGLKHILISDIGKNITDIYAKLGTEGI